MIEQRIQVNQERAEQQIPVNQLRGERAITVGDEPSVLHGIDGVSPIVTVTQTEDGAIISITDRDGTTTAEIMNGEQGEQGEPGQAATITVGNTTTGAAGTNASVTNSGTSNAAILNFTIPRGDTGAPGKDGVDGKDGRDGIDGKDGSDGRDGIDGKDGKDGLAATVSVGTVTTGQAGTSASVTNSGTSSAAVFNFTIPRGDTGATGADGYSPTASVSKSGDTATITITDKNSTTSAQISDGTNGNPGADGFSPIATVTKSGDTATISITDKNGTTTASVTEPTKTSDLVNDGSDNTSTYVEADELAAVATSGNYSDLNGTPAIPTVNNATLTIQKNSTNVATFTANASSDVTADISVPTKTSDLINDGSDNTSTYVETDELATVATSGLYSDLTGTPTIPAAQVNSDWNSNSGVSQILNKPSLATVATSGSYSDLTNKPTIPTVNNATLTIQKNGTDVQTFTANQSTDVTANIAVPTKTSDLTNDGSDNTSTYLEADETAYRGASIPFGVVDNTSTSTAFTATVPGITELRDGVCMWLKNGTVTSAAGFTININGLGAKPAYSNMAAATAESTMFNVNYTFMFVYDSTRVAGGCWMLNRGYNSNDNTIGYQVRTNNQSLPASDAFVRYRLLFTSADGTKYVPANTSTSTNATASRTVNQTKINPFGRIFYYSSTTAIAQGSRPGVGVLWEQYPLVLGYSFNRTGAALTLTSWKPVYIKCAPQTDGSAIIDSTTPYVQDLPTTEDGKIYIFLGIAYDATHVELQLDHPIYEYKGGMIRPWVNAVQGVTSFNGSTGAVTYTAPVTSVNGSTGAITGLQTTTNLVTSVSSASTDSQYPSAKLLYDTVGDVETVLQTLNNGGGAQ